MSATLIRRRIAPDGSCLFNSIDFLVNDRQDRSQELRETCCARILADPAIYDELYLGRPPSDYTAWLTDPCNYGGEVEIVILAKEFGVKIVVATIESLTLLPYAPPVGDGDAASPPPRKVFIYYNGQHYDAIAAEDGARSFPDGGDALADGDLDERVVALLTTEKAARDLELRTRQRKRIRCSCGYLCASNDGKEWEMHCKTTTEHDDDFAWECDEVLIEEIVGSEKDE